MSTLREALTFLKQKGPAPAAVPTPSPAWEKLHAETLKILTPEQVAEYKTLLSNPAKMQKLLGNGGVQDPQSMFRGTMPHGIPTRVEVSTVVGGKPKVKAEFNNAFASTVMTTSQMERLEKERLKGIGVWAFKKPDVRSALELTDEQVPAIEAILLRPAPQMEVKFPSPGGDFQKESEEFHKRAREHHELGQEHFKKQCQDIKDLLSETQRSRFTEMTGFQFPKGPTI